LLQGSKVVDLFTRLVSIDSYSGREGRLAEYVVGCLGELGADVIVDGSAKKTGSDTGNIIARLPGNVSAAPAILFCAHMDTIGPTEGMQPIIKDGVIYSNGETVLGADDKAGIAVILTGLAELRDKKINHGDLEIVLTVKEEVGMLGAKNLDIELKSDFGYVLDGDGPVGTVINQAPSHINMDLVILGKAAHAGICPERGINAIVTAATAISRIRSGRIDEETTTNFGVINGGQARNIVPERVEVKAEARSLDENKLEWEVKTILDEFSKTAAETGARFTADTEYAYRAFSIPEIHPVVAYALKAARSIGVEPVLRSTGGGLDANIFNERGLPCVALGLGYDDPHSPKESIPVVQLEAGVQFLLAIIKQAAGIS